jgi:RNA polymerase sigma factor (TIGR02999 family)
MDQSEGVTEMLRAWQRGDNEARDLLFAFAYEELRKRAAARLRREREDHTLQPTALVHEVYLRLTRAGPITWQNRSHFFAVAAGMMRRILVDHARSRAAERRGSGLRTVALDEATVAKRTEGVDVLALDSALDRLAALDTRQSQVVELRYFGGMSVDETAHVLGVSSPTVKREWAAARAWLFRELAS